MKYIKYGLPILGAVLVFLIGSLLRPWFFAAAGDRMIAAFPAKPGESFSIRFIHSVQKTPVVENLVINDTQDGFILISTKYQSFGVGLPFLAEEGEFHKEGDYFDFDQMNRRFSSLSLRTGVGTELTLTLQDKEYRLYEQMPPGSRIDLYIAPYYKKFLR